MIRSLILAVTLILICPAFVSAETAFLPHGPGHVFSSVDAAAVDALARAHELQSRSHQPRLSRGGTIVAVEGGFTYRAIQTASPDHPDGLRLRLGEDVVAHFHTYPSQGEHLDRRNERHSPADRRIVDQLDSKRRPSFVLTPSLRVVVYRGSNAGGAREGLVAELPTSERSRSVAQF